MDPSILTVQRLGRRDYQPVWQAMQAFTAARGPATADALWMVEHAPVYTLGRNGARTHILEPGDIPVIPVDRGGQVTYHGPGQVVAYVLVDLRRRAMGVRNLVSALEQGVIDLLETWGIGAHSRPDAPGVYVDHAKVAALGLRVRRGCSFHGLALNVDMDLTPFERINPCGFQGLAVTQLRDLGVADTPEGVAQALEPYLARRLGYRRTQVVEWAPFGTNAPDRAMMQANQGIAHE